MPNNNAQPAESAQTELPPVVVSAASSEAGGEASGSEAARPNPVAEHIEALRKLLGEVGVQQVIWVDDDFAVDREDAAPTEYFDLIEDTECRTLPGLADFPSELPEGVRGEQFKNKWKSLDCGVRQDLFRKLYDLATSRGADPSTHMTVASHFAQVPGCEVRTMSLREWREEQTGWVESRFEGKFTLLLIDQDFGKEGGPAEGGTAILKNLQDSIPDPEAEKLRCALLTQPLIREEHTAWDKFATTQDLKRSRFMLISKQRLTDDQLGGFLMMLRLAILNPLCESLRVEAEGVYQKALDTAKLQIAGMTIYDVEQIVFASSRREGVWEPDTLFRILGMYLRRDARKHAFGSPQLRDLADRVRKIAGARSLDPSPKQEGTKALEIRQLELYEDPDYLNKHFTPIDLGDIFEIERGPGADPKLYILVAQPCDMMVRLDDPAGERKRGVTDGMVLEIMLDLPVVNGQSVRYDPTLMSRLDYFQQSGSHAYVDFSTARPVSLAILDLCVMREDGQAEIAVFDKIPDGLIPSWKAHNLNIRRGLRAAGDSWDAVMQACKDLKAQKQKVNKAVADAEFGPVFGPHFWVPYTPTRKGKGNTHIRFGCKRIRRLNQPWSGALLTAYTQYLGRAAFEHDYGSIGFDVANVQPAMGHEQPAAAQG